MVADPRTTRSQRAKDGGMTRRRWLRKTFHRQCQGQMFRIGDSRCARRYADRAQSTEACKQAAYVRKPEYCNIICCTSVLQLTFHLTIQEFYITGQQLAPIMTLHANYSTQKKLQTPSCPLINILLRDSQSLLNAWEQVKEGPVDVACLYSWRYKHCPSKPARVLFARL